MRRIVLYSIAIAFVTFASEAKADDAATPDYVKDVAPILNKYCTACHSADEPEGKLSLESFVDLQKGGEHGASVVPGQATSSRMIRVLTGEAEPQMPPKDNEAPSDAEIATLIAWIDAGATGPEGVEPPRVLVTPTLPAAKGAGAITAIAMSAAAAPPAQVMIRPSISNRRLLGARRGKSSMKPGWHSQWSVNARPSSNPAFANATAPVQMPPKRPPVR